MIEIIPNWHPLMVHFTIALLSMSILFFILQKPLFETEIGDNFNIFARYSLFLGVLFSILTVVAGWFAFNSVDHDTPSHLAMIDHRFWALITFGVFVVAGLWLKFSSAMRETVSIPFLVFIIIGGVLLATTGFKGAELVYKHGLGVQSLPKAANHDHESGSDHGGAGHHDVGSEVAPHGHGGDHHDEMKIDAQSMKDMEMGMDAEPSPPMDKDGISIQPLPVVELPVQAIEEAPAAHADDGHAH